MDIRHKTEKQKSEGGREMREERNGVTE